MSDSSQEWKAAKYLNKINPKRYIMKRYHQTIMLIDNKSFPTHHTRVSSHYTVSIGFWGKKPLAILILGDNPWTGAVNGS